MPREELLNIFKKYKYDNEIFHDLMNYKVRELLLVATVYDAFSLEQDGLLSEKIFGEYYNLNLTNAPRVTSVTSATEAIDMLNKKKFDLVVVLSRLSKTETIKAGAQIRGILPNIPILLLLNDNTDLVGLDHAQDIFKAYDNVFVWNGASEIFLAMIKYVEDNINAVNDTQIGQVRIILLIEDSTRYYSRYLSHLYRELIKQTSRLIEEELQDESKKVLRMRCRPKILLATNYEKAMEIYEKFKEYILCVISDMKYPKDGVLDEMAGVKLVKALREKRADLPVLLQSFEQNLEIFAKELNIPFVNKASQFLTNQLSNFFYYNLGFGDFIFRNAEDGKEIARAANMAEFRLILQTVPIETIVYHATRNHFSTWLLARGEVQTAKLVSQIHVSAFKCFDNLRDFLINMGDWINKVKTRGKVIAFDESFLGDSSYHILKLSDGAIGGKGRGLAFINHLLNSRVSPLFAKTDIKIPETFIIGTDEFDKFIEFNKLETLIEDCRDYEEIKKRFLNSDLSEKLLEKLKTLLTKIKYPLAVRSSGVLEDSVAHSMSGLYETFFLPNNGENLDLRLKLLCDAIKLVYASVYSNESREYFDAISYKIEEEKMAVVIQQIVGKSYGEHFYPIISGVGQSYNYYPVSHMEPEDGVGMIVLGLGGGVVGGGSSFRFCPKYPKIQILSDEDLLKTTQKKFLALQLENSNVDLFADEDATLIEYDIKQAEKDETLATVASTWIYEDNRVEPGIYERGPRLLNFANVLQYDLFPLAETLRHVLYVSRAALEAPVEVEFAIERDEETKDYIFYLLQIKHFLRDMEEFSLNKAEISKSDLMLFADKGMGNGRTDDIYDIVWADPELFDKSKTEEMAYEVHSLNSLIKETGKKYILIGPGRWGTRDKWLGIPISWSNASHAKVIVEYSLEDFRVDASMGSHFFHNVTTMNIGYFSVRQDSGDGFIDWKWLRAQPALQRKKYFVHTRLSTPVSVLMDGRNGIFAIQKS